MNPKMERFFKRRAICPEDIVYILKDGQRTVVHLLDGTAARTDIPLKWFREELSPEQFLSITKGVIIAAAQIANIQGCLYTMNDGRVFQGRLRTVGEHSRNRRHLESKLYRPFDSSADSLSGRMAVLDKMPVAFCIIELVFQEDGHGVDFIFRYCNDACAQLEGVPRDQIINRSFYEIFRNGDKKWLVIYADVALNGTTRTIADYSPEIGKHLTIYCHQPEEGFCACLLLETPSPAD